ncbi:COMM domain-containing protein 6-like isoform X1 [Rhopilema esculentum]|uniref:COMM domain-containing protein 6-like isoform X1 n=1 Tax=Rhopilema esculentum TaxID=499914 RepID=UPI0031CF00E2
MAHLRPPDDLASAGDLITCIPNAILSELCMNILMFIQYKKSDVQTSRIHELLQAQDVSITVSEVQKAANAICFHYRCAVANKMSTEDLIASLQKYMFYADDKIKIISEAWKLEGKFLMENDIKDHLNVGELVSLDWKLSMAVSSTMCKSLNAPIVTMFIKVLNQNGEIIGKAFEMTVDQFQKFSKQLEDTKSVLDTV